MFYNYLKIAFRGLRKHRGYAMTNILGLAIGFAVTFLIILFIQFELTYDTFHEREDRLYRVSVVANSKGNQRDDSPEFTAPIGPAMKAEFPEVENFVRLSTRRVTYLSDGNRAFKLQRVVHADSTLFDIFSFHLKAGNPRVALVAPFSIVLSEDVAQRIFGEDNPLDRTVMLNGDVPYKVTGVVERPSENSHIQFDALVSFSTLYHIPNVFMDWNGGNQYITFVLLREHATPKDVQEKFPAFMWNHINKQLAGVNVRYEPYLQPLTQIHLRYNDYSASLVANLYVFGSIAVLLLFIASANFVNLANARAISRAKEVGVRKVMGAGRANLFRQFLGESFLLTCVAVLMALFLMELMIPFFQELLGRTVSLGSLVRPTTIAIFCCVIFIVAVGSGSYPAFYLSSLDVTRALKGGTLFARSKVRDGLVILQFAISIALIFCTIAISRQLDFIQGRELGFEKNNMVMVPLIGDGVKEKSSVLKAELSQLPGVTGVTASSDVPLAGFTRNGYFPEGMNTPIMIHVVDVDEDFLPTFGITIVAGRNFSAASPADNDGYLINEELARTLNWENPIGRKIRRNGDHEIIGVVKDFHFSSLYDKIEPLIITNRPWGDTFSVLSIKLIAGNPQETMASIKAACERVSPSAPFTYTFVDDALELLYKNEQRSRMLFGWSALIAIAIAVMGLLSLVSLSIEQRTKEIGIRKVLGASVLKIVVLLSSDVVRLVLAASLIAFPLAYIAATRWLDDFAYRREVEPWIFLGAAMLALAVALASVSYRAGKAALANPVDALRYE